MPSEPFAVCRYEQVDAFGIPHACALPKLQDGQCVRCPHHVPEALPVEEDVAEAWRDIKPKPKEIPEAIKAKVQELSESRTLTFNFFTLSEREKALVLEWFEWILGHDAGAVRIGQRALAEGLVRRLRESNSRALQDGIPGPRHTAAARDFGPITFTRHLSSEEQFLGPGVTDPYPEPLEDENLLSDPDEPDSGRGNW